jgi:hypothetical protein
MLPQTRATDHRASSSRAGMRAVVARRESDSRAGDRHAA